MAGLGADCRGRCLHRPAEIYGIASCKICGIPGLSIGHGHPTTPKLRRITHCKSCAELFPLVGDDVHDVPDGRKIIAHLQLICKQSRRMTSHGTNPIMAYV